MFSEIRRQQITDEGGWSLWFWRDRSNEVDFLSHRGGTFDLADAKLAVDPRPSEARALRKVMASLAPERVRSASLLCRTAQSYPLDEHIWARSLSERWPAEA